MFTQRKYFVGRWLRWTFRARSENFFGHLWSIFIVLSANIWASWRLSLSSVSWPIRPYSKISSLPLILADQWNIAPSLFIPSSWEIPFWIFHAPTSSRSLMNQCPINSFFSSCFLFFSIRSYSTFSNLLGISTFISDWWMYSFSPSISSWMYEYLYMNTIQKYRYTYLYIINILIVISWNRRRF